MARRIAIGLYNSYDPKAFHEAMRRAVVRAAPLAAAFDLHLALFGFPFEAYETAAGERPNPRTPVAVADVLAESTSVGEAGRYLKDLAAGGRFHVFGFPDRGFPPQLGTPVLATRAPEAAKRIEVQEVVERADREPLLVLVGLGPRGVPKKIHALCAHHLELTAKSYALETATALGVLAGRLAEAQQRPRGPRLAVDAVVLRDRTVLLVQRGRPPFRGVWALPGGFVDGEETVEGAVLRELREETGVRGERPRLVGAFSGPGRDPRGPLVSLAYRVEAPTGAPRPSTDAARAAFHPLAELPPLAFDHAEILRAALGTE